MIKGFIEFIDEQIKKELDLNSIDVNKSYEEIAIEVKARKLAVNKLKIVKKDYENYLKSR